MSPDSFIERDFVAVIADEMLTRYFPTPKHPGYILHKVVIAPFIYNTLEVQYGFTTFALSILTLVPARYYFIGM